MHNQEPKHTLTAQGEEVENDMFHLEKAWEAQPSQITQALIVIELFYEMGRLHSEYQLTLCFSYIS